MVCGNGRQEVLKEEKAEETTMSDINTLAALGHSGCMENKASIHMHALSINTPNI
jgi:hypothetical protein